MYNITISLNDVNAGIIHGTFSGKTRVGALRKLKEWCVGCGLVFGSYVESGTLVVMVDYQIAAQQPA